MDCVLSECVFYVVFFGRAVPVAVEFMYFYCNIAKLLAVEAFVDLAEAALSQKTEQLVFSDARPNAVAACFEPTVPRVLLLVK